MCCGAKNYAFENDVFSRHAGFGKSGLTHVAYMGHSVLERLFPVYRGKVLFLNLLFFCSPVIMNICLRSYDLAGLLPPLH